MKTMTSFYLKIFALMMIYHSATAQTTDTLWTNTFGGSSIDIAYSIQQTNDSGFIVAGYANSTDGDVHGNHGANDYWILKLDDAGDTLWTKTYGGSNQDVAYSIQQTFDTGYIAAGYTWSTDCDVSGNHGTHDFWIIKLNDSGDTAWTKCLGGSSYDDAYSIQQTSDSGYVVAGFTSSNDGDVHRNHGYRDFWVVKLQKNGDTTWTKTFGGKSKEEAQSIQQTDDGGYVVAGTAYSNNGDVHGNHGADDYWVVRLDNNGDTLWTKAYGGSGWDNAFSIQQTFDDGFIIAGAGASYDGDVHGYQGGEADFWIIKTDGNGDTLWTRTYGGSNLDVANSVQQTADSGYIVTGYTHSTDGDVHGNNGGSDYWVIKLNHSGDTVWTKTLGGSLNEEANSIQQTNTGNIIIAGDARSSDGDVHGNNGFKDFWVVELEGPAIDYYSVDHDIPLTYGWNNLSFNVSPEDSNMMVILQPLIDAGELIKATDEAGGIVQNVPGIGWVNTIGNMANTEGYYIKVNNDSELQLSGVPVNTPFSIPLSAGWNIMGYPLNQTQNALAAVQSLIDEGELIKVMDEAGGFIQEIPGIGWVNTIRNFVPGEGYYIKVTTNTSLTLDNLPSKVNAPVATTRIKHQFTSTSSGNPYLPMNIVVSGISVDGHTVQAGDEIAVYDNELLLGVAKISADKNDLVNIVVAKDDPLTTAIDGYTDGNLPTFRFQSASLFESISLHATPVFGSPNYSEMGTLVCNLLGSVTDIEDEQDIPLGLRCIPNPASDFTTIAYNLAEAGNVQLSVYDLSGRQIKLLQDEMQLSGMQQFRFDVGILDKGLYIIKAQIKNKSTVHSEIIKFVKN